MISRAPSAVVVKDSANQNDIRLREAVQSVALNMGTRKTLDSLPSEPPGKPHVVYPFYL